MRHLLEQAVTKHLGAPWHIVHFQDLNDLASHPCALLSDGNYAVFAKLSLAMNAAAQFEAELNGLRLVSSLAGVAVPTPIGIVAAPDAGAVLLLEGVQAVARTTVQWRHIGQTLARIHRVRGAHFGLETNGYFGPLYQDNRPLPDWPTFYAERRLWPRLISAIDAGHMPADVAQKIERVIVRLPELCGPVVTPVLLHGDAQQNNFISTAAGAMVVDPAVHFGHPELDLAYLGYWQPVPDDVLLAYQEEMPIDAGFAKRYDLWRLSGWLAAVAVGGRDYLPQVVAAVEGYV